MAGYLTCESVIVGLKREHYDQILKAIEDSPSLADKDRVELKSAMKIDVPVHCKDSVVSPRGLEAK